MASDSSSEDDNMPSYIAMAGSGSPEEMMDTYLQIPAYALNSERPKSYIRKRLTTKPWLAEPRNAIFCKRGLTLMHKYITARFNSPIPRSVAATPPPPLRLSDHPELLALRPITVSDLSESNETKHSGSILFGTICVQPFYMHRHAQISVLEEASHPGSAIRLHIYNAGHLYPPGTRVAIKEPFFKTAFAGICVKAASRGLFPVASFPLAIDLEAIEELRRRGNHCFRLCAWEKAVELYTRCIERRPADADVRHLRESIVPVYSNRAAAFLNMGEWEKALEDAEEALAIDGSHMKSMFRKGRALEEMKRFGEAQVWLSRAKGEAQGSADIDEIAAALERVRMEAVESLD